MTKTQAQKIASMLKRRFGGKVEFEKLIDSKNYRFAITSKQFEKMTQLGRQDAVWAAIDEEISRDVLVDISLILTYAPKELILA